MLRLGLRWLQAGGCKLGSAMDPDPPRPQAWSGSLAATEHTSEPRHVEVVWQALLARMLALGWAKFHGICDWVFACYGHQI